MEIEELDKMITTDADEEAPEETIESLPEEGEESPFDEYYDAQQLKSEVLSLLSKFPLSDLEFNPNQYHLFLDNLGFPQQALEFIGADKLQVTETDEGFAHGDQIYKSVEDMVEPVILPYLTELATYLTTETGLPGSFFFDFEPEENMVDLFYFFEADDIPELENLGVQIQQSSEPVDFNQIISALVEENCDDLAERLHQILHTPEQ